MTQIKVPQVDTAESTGVQRIKDPVEMLTIPVSSIEFKGRARQKYTNLPQLAQAIIEKGLIQPIAVVRLSEGGKPYRLLAGGRRFSACALAGLKEIPARIYPSNLDPLETREIELMENVEREDLTWQEKDRLTKSIDELFVEKFGRAIGPSEGHSKRDTAKILGKSPTQANREIELAEALDEYGEDSIIGQAKTEDEAYRILKRTKRKEEHEVAAKKFDKELETDGGDAAKRQLVNGYIVADFFEGVAAVPDRAVSFVEIDPPYGVSLNTLRKDRNEATMENYKDIEESDYPEFLEKLLAECHRVMFAESWLILWFAWRWHDAARKAIEKAGFVCPEVPGFWVKNTPGQTHQPWKRFGNQVEQFLYCRKGEASMREAGRGNTFQYKLVHNEKKIHPAERPIEMIEDILKIFCPPGSHIMVPFLGSGNTLLASANLGFSGFGFDLSEEYRNSFVARVQEGKPKEYRSYG